MLRFSHRLTRRFYYNSVPVLSKKFLRKKQEDVHGLPPNFLQQLKEWPPIFKKEIEEEFTWVKDILEASNHDWSEIEERGMAVSNLRFESESFDALDGKLLHFKFPSGRYSKMKQSKSFRRGTPVMLCKSETLHSLAECIYLYTSHDEITLKLMKKKGQFDHDKKYVILPSQDIGTLQTLTTVLDIKNIKKTQGKNLLNLAYSGEVMPSIHSDVKLRNISEELNDSQRRAVAAAINNKRPFVCIQGPPGTGKTRVIAEIIKEFIRKKSKVLVCAPSVVAVNNVMEKTQALIASKDDDDRFINNARLVEAIAEHPDYTELCDSSEQMGYSITKEEKSRNTRSFWKLRAQIIMDVYKPRKVIFSTLTNHVVQSLRDYEWIPDVVIIDEAAQCTEPAAWAAVLKAPRCILVGDHAQLPPTIRSTEGKKGGLEVSLMERLCNEYKNCNLSFLLSTQYRMNEIIMNWSSQQFYNSQLIADDSVANIRLSDISLVPEDDVLNNPMLLIDTGNEDDSREETHHRSIKNTNEVQFIAQYTNYLLSAGVPANSIGIITPYYAQTQAMKNMILADVAINTVDGFQGQEKDVIIFSLVRNNVEHRLGFLREARRMNVAVTRAKRQFCLVGSTQMLLKNKNLRSLYNYIKKNGAVLKMNDVNLTKTQKKSARRVGAL